MSEKGVLSKSIANNISEAIIDKLGGTGYAPTEWSKNINLLGIASEDIEEALASITEDASSSDKGLLSLSIASDMGAILNKKYNTSRGFKPSEVSSAVSALIPLPKKTIPSASVCSFSDGAEDVPTKSLVVTIPPTISGVSSVTETQTGRNLFDISTATNGQINGTNGAYYTNTNWQASDFFPVHGTNLTLSWDTDSSNYYQVNLAFYDSEKHYVDGSNNTFANIYSKSFTIPSGAVYCRASWSISVGGNPAPRNNIRINLGSTDGGYTPYTAPTQYTADLGRTIYGGTPDIVNGTGKSSYKIITVGNSGWNYYASGGYIYKDFNDKVTPTLGDTDHVLVTDNPDMPYGGVNYASQFQDLHVYQAQNKAIYIKDTSCTSVNDFYTKYSNMQIGYELDTPTDFTFTGQDIPTRLGYNAFWSDSGDTEVTYRADLDLYEAPSALSDTNNTETEENEEQEVNE